MNKKIFISQDLPKNTGGRMIVDRNIRIAESLGYNILLFKKQKGIFNSLSFIFFGVPIELGITLLKGDFTHMWFDRSTYLISVIRKFIKPKTIIITYYHNNEFYFKSNIDKLKGDSLKRRIIRLIFLAKEFGQRKKSDLSVFINKTEMDKKYHNHIFLPPTFDVKLIHNQSSDLPRIFIYYNDYLPNKIGFEWLKNDLKKSIFDIDIISRDQSFYDDLPSNLSWKFNISSLEKYLVQGNILIAPILDTNGFKIKIAEALVHGLTVITTSVLYDNLVLQGVPINSLVELKSPDNLDIIIKKAMEVRPNTELYIRYFSLEGHKESLEKIAMLSLK
jgi:hypothetical protein